MNRRITRIDPHPTNPPDGENGHQTKRQVAAAYAAASLHLNRRKATLETAKDYSGTGENRHHHRSARTLTV